MGPIVGPKGPVKDPKEIRDKIKQLLDRSGLVSSVIQEESEREPLRFLLGAQPGSSQDPKIIDQKCVLKFPKYTRVVLVWAGGAHQNSKEEPLRFHKQILCGPRWAVF